MFKMLESLNIDGSFYYDADANRVDNGRFFFVVGKLEAKQTARQMKKNGTCTVGRSFKFQVLFLSSL